MVRARFYTKITADDPVMSSMQDDMNNLQTSGTTSKQPESQHPTTLEEFLNTQTHEVLVSGERRYVLKDNDDHEVKNDKGILYFKNKDQAKVIRERIHTFPHFPRVHVSKGPEHPEASH